MSTIEIPTSTYQVRSELLSRNDVLKRFFDVEAIRLARACREMSERFLNGGRLLAFGAGAAATDAQHVAVEFVHPVIVGKRALPAMDLGPAFESRISVLVQPEDMVMAFAFGGREIAVTGALRSARERGGLTFALSGDGADYTFDAPSPDPFVCQELFEVLYHVLWETVHIYFEHREQGHDVGASGFLYPFLGKSVQEVGGVEEQVRLSMLQKAAETNALRTALAENESDFIASAAEAIAQRIRRGGKLLVFGNGGSATDANDLAEDCVAPPDGLRPVPAVSLSSEPANLTAIANDIGVEAIFTRQLIAHATPNDVAVAFSTSGGSANVIAALVEARKRGLLTVAFLGYDGGRIVQERLADHAIVVRSDYIPRIQEAQASAYHVLRRAIDANLHA